MIWGLIILCGIAMAAYVQMISGYTRSWDDVDGESAAEKLTLTTTITVVVSARNESKNIAACINSLKAQSYPANLLSIILLDDHSEDDTALIANELTTTDSRFQIIQLEGDESGKKDAISKAVAMSNSELIVTTDADCEHNPDWIKELASTYERIKPDMILAPVVFKHKPSILNRVLRLEFLALMGSSGASAAQTEPTMCNGANLCYKREAFHKVGGFEGVDNNPSGDDVFLMLKLHERRNGSVVFTKASNSIVTTHAPASFKAFWQQRKRWLSKRSGYTHQHVKKAAYTVFFGNLAMLVCLWMAAQFCLIKPIWAMAILIIAAKILIDRALLVKVGRDLGVSVNLIDILLAELFLAVYIPLLGLAGRSSSYTWKNRKIDLND